MISRIDTTSDFLHTQNHNKSSTIAANSKFDSITSKLKNLSDKLEAKADQLSGKQPVSNMKPAHSSPAPIKININVNTQGVNILLDLKNTLSNQFFNLSISGGSNANIALNFPKIGHDDFGITINFGGDGDKHVIQPDKQGSFTKPLADETISRLAPAGEGAKTGEMSGKDRPAPREISNAVASQHGKETKNNNNASDLLWSWGQFIDHDMVLTKEGEEKTIIGVPKGDPGLDPTGTGRGFIPFTRSEGVKDSNGIRQQVNEQTPLIDASMVYGATPEETEHLRSHIGGQMKIAEDGFLPSDPETMVLSGDKRAAEQPGLLSLHTLFVREHNRQAAHIAKNNPLMSDDRIFAEARKIVTAEIQAITYNEFLPVLLGEQNSNPDNFHIDQKTNDGKVSNEFATAAYRLGHTLVSEKVAIKQADGSIKQVGLDDVFFQPEFTKKEGIGAILSGQSEQTSEKVDPQIVDGLRNRLFGPPGSGAPGLDLASLNIQRGRDHNLPSYNEMRETLGIQKIESFDDPIFQDGVGEQLASVYGSTDEIDLWVGGLAENASGSSMLGETFTKIVSEQFAKTAKADEHFYTRSMSASDRQWLNNLTLSDIIRANTQNTNIDDTAFIVG